MSKNNIPMMVIKGYTLARLYPKPERRIGGDIDIFLFDKQEEGDCIIRNQYGGKSET